MPRRGGWFKEVALAVLLAMLVCAPELIVAAMHWAGYGWGYPFEDLRRDVLLALTAAFGILFAAVAYAVGFPVLARRMFFGASALILVAPVAFLAGALLEMDARDRVTERARPLVDAFETSIAVKGAPPTSISDLVPRFIERVPERLPPMRLVTGKEAFEHFGGNTWVLQASLAYCRGKPESFE